MHDLAIDFSLGAFLAAFFVFKAVLLVRALRTQRHAPATVPVPVRSGVRRRR